MPDSLFYRWKAEEDLASLYRGLARHNIDRAREFVVSIEDRCQSLCDFPQQGRRRDDLGEGIRILPYARSIIIAYRIMADCVEILRVFDGGSDYERSLRQTDND